MKWKLYCALGSIVVLQLTWIKTPGSLWPAEHAVANPSDPLADNTGLEDLDLSESFALWPAQRGVCGGNQIGEWFRTHSIKEAMAACMHEPGCIFFTRWGDEVPRGSGYPSGSWIDDSFISHGFTILCSGFVDHAPGPKNGNWVSGARRGCEKFPQIAADSVALFAPKARPLDCIALPCGQCRGPAVHQVVGCSVKGKHVCHECLAGSCPEVMAAIHPKFTSVLNQEAKRFSQRRGRPFYATSPTFLKHEGETFLVVRLTDQGRCSGTSWAPPPKQPYESWVLMCRLSTQAQSSKWPSISACRVLEIDLLKLLASSGYVPAGGSVYVSDFLGFEDVSGFSWRGSIWLVGSALFRRRWQITAEPVSRQIVVKLSPEMDRAVSATVLFPAAGGECRDDTALQQKGWMFLRPADDGVSVLFVYSVEAFLVIHCNIRTGCCTEVPTERKGVSASSLEGYRGGAPAVLAPGKRQYWLLVHRRVDFEPPAARSLPPVYHHMIAVMDAESPFTLREISKPFRLPTLPVGVVPESYVQPHAQDIQFAAGMFFDSEGALHVGYGVADCVPAYARIVPASMDLWPLPIPNQTLEGLPFLRSGPKVSHGPRVRLEGPIRSMQSFAGVSRRIAEGLWESVQLSIWDTGDIVDLNAFQEMLRETGERENFGVWRRSVITSSRWNGVSSTMADVTVRNLWPVQMHAPAKGRLVLNFPWEFYHVPTKWARKMTKDVDEIWTPTAYVKRGLVASGVPESKVTVIPYGVDEREVCSRADGGQRDRQRREFRHSVLKRCPADAFIFLYHGGVLPRKGVDKILQAYFGEFTGQDRVCLVMHAAYWDVEAWRSVQTFYERSQQIAFEPARRTEASVATGTLESWKGVATEVTVLNCTTEMECSGFCHVDGKGYLFSEELSLTPARGSDPESEFCRRKVRSSRPGRPRPPAMTVTTRMLSTLERSELYAMSDALVHPSRAEGFGLAVAEAMVCNLSVITTDKGAVTDFTSEDTVWQVPSTETRCTAQPCNASSGVPTVFGEAMANPPLWLDFDHRDLGRVMRAAMEQREASDAKRRRAHAYASSALTWRAAQSAMVARVRRLMVSTG